MAAAKEFNNPLALQILKTTHNGTSLWKEPGKTVNSRVKICVKLKGWAWVVMCSETLSQGMLLGTKSISLVLGNISSKKKILYPYGKTELSWDKK